MSLLEPDNAATLNQLGLALAQDGQLDSAVASFQQAIAIDPSLFAAHDNLGTALGQLGRFDEAAASFQKACQINSRSAETHFKLGIVREKLGRYAEAVKSFRETQRCNPGHRDVHRNLSMALAELGRFDEAVAILRKTVNLQPRSVASLNALGVVLQKQGKLDDAAATFQQAIRLKPDYALAFGNLRNVYRQQGKLEEAVVHCRRATQLHPESAVAHNSLGTALQLQGKLDEAAVAFEEALRVKPDLAAAAGNLGHTRRDQGWIDKAVECYRRAIGLQPDDAYQHSNLLYALHFHPEYDVTALAEEHRCWRERHADPLRKFIRPHVNVADPVRRLKVGYVSPNFYSQAERFFVVPLVEHHDREHVEVHCYSSVLRPDAMTVRLQKSADVWHDVLRLPNESLAEKIRSDGIDILVDLTMHMGNRRMTLFARKPAPVQVAWLAYPGSTGLDTIDYRLTDAFMEPQGADDSWSSEKPIRLPDCWCCYDPIDEFPPVNDPPAQVNGHVTFGSLNASCKHNEVVLRLWARVLAAVPESRLLLLSGEGSHREAMRAIFAVAGVSATRIEFLMPGPRREYLMNYHKIDICLDPLPYNGITTTCDAFGMGVPVVSLLGKTPASRAGLCLLSMVGLPELVGATEEEFIQIATDLAGNLSRLKELRRTLRQRTQASPLMDAPRFARNVEAAYRTMWHGWCKSQRLGIAQSIG